MIKKKIVKFFYSVKGWNIERKMKIGDYYTSKHVPNSRYMYRGKHLFYEAFMASPYPGVVYQEQRKRTFKYWEIGIFDFKKDNIWTTLT